MQQLSVEFKNVPVDASLVRCSTSLQLNRDQSLSVVDKVLTDNNPEVNHRQHAGGSDLRVLNIVYVLNQRGLPLMPTSQAVARKLLKKGVACVVKRFPYVIQLTIASGENKQKINLGIDTGFGNIGFSATTEKKELISGTLILDKRTKERLNGKRMYRRNRRNKLWYREPRWLNRIKPEGWLPPSIERRYLIHLNLISKFQNLLPITNIIIEIAKFDIQKIENPDIQGIGYQQGTLYDYQNIRSYLMSREKGKCQLCGEDFKGQASLIHHIKPRSQGGNDRPNNLALLHKKCHTELHENNLKLKSNSKDYKQSTFMNIINKRFFKNIPNLKITYGNITWVNRNDLGLEKTHYNDAFVISGGSKQERIKPIEIKQVHRNNRVLQLNRKGFKPSIKRNKSKVNPGDLFWVGNKQYSCKAMFSYGTAICYGSTKKKEYFNFKKVEKIFHFGSFVWNI
jgi:hypothetical protein